MLSSSISPHRAAFLILIIATATIIGAWIFEYFGYAPCELCLKQRWAYYAAIPVAVILLFFGNSSSKMLMYGLVLLAAIWLASTIFGIFHSGVEWGWWPGPSTCTGTGQLSGGLPDLSAPVVMCDKPAIRILGLSLAGWNALISLGLLAIASAGARSYGSNSVSQ